METKRARLNWQTCVGRRVERAFNLVWVMRFDGLIRAGFEEIHYIMQVHPEKYNEI